MSKIKLTCLSLDCPERFSLCCGAGSRAATEPELMLGVPEFYCSKCGKPFEGGECTASPHQPSPEENWEKEFDKHFPPRAIADAIEGWWHRIPDPSDIKSFIRSTRQQAREEVLEIVNGERWKVSPDYNDEYLDHASIVNEVLDRICAKANLSVKKKSVDDGGWSKPL